MGGAVAPRESLLIWGDSRFFLPTSQPPGHRLLGRGRDSIRHEKLSDTEVIFSKSMTAWWAWNSTQRAAKVTWTASRMDVKNSAEKHMSPSLVTP